MTEPVDLRVPETEHDSRLDMFVSVAVQDLSRSRARLLIESGLVLVDGAAAGKPSLRLKPGQLVTVLPGQAEPPDLVAWDVTLTVVYEDDDLVVIDKPAGMPVHPGPGHQGDTLANALVARWPDVSGVGQPSRPGIVHRLDADTSGLIIVARTARAHADLSGQFEGRTVQKMYTALVSGTPRLNEAVIEAPIGRSPGHRQKMAVVSSGRPASTRYTVTRRFDASTLVEARPTTGRTHQIRVHFDSIGHPVIGDALYGTADPHLGRHFLHASEIGFRHPVGGGNIELTSSLPEDLISYLSEVLNSRAEMTGAE